MLHSLLDQITRLPRNPFKLARALVRSTPTRRRSGPEPVVPRIYQPLARPINPPPARRPGTPPLILFVHPDIDLCEGVRDVLELEGFQAITASTSREALAICERENFDAMIIRYPLGRETGELLIAQVRRIPHCRTVPLIVMTVIGSREDVRFLNQYRVSSWLIQPFDPDDLLTALREIR